LADFFGLIVWEHDDRLLCERKRKVGGFDSGDSVAEKQSARRYAR
jgi:hypothetical protein